MIRMLIENTLLFLLPAMIYAAYVLLTRPPEEAEPGSAKVGHAQRILDDAPLAWLFAAGAFLVIATLIAFGNTSGGKPGTRYEPPTMKDGEIQPGHMR